MKAAAVSASGRHVLTVLGNGFIFRYQYAAPESKEGAEGGPEGAEGKENAAAENQGDVAPVAVAAA